MAAQTEEEQEVQYKESKPPTLCLQVSLQTLSLTPLQPRFGHKAAFYCEYVSRNEVAAHHFQFDLSIREAFAES